MKKDLTEIIFLLDMSGSMSIMKTEAINGFNTLINDQKKQEGEAQLTLVLFDDRYIVQYDGVDIKDVSELTEEIYQPLGMTAYFDALGKTISSVGSRLNDTPEELRPEKVIFAIMTDGQENASREYTSETIKERIKHQEEKYSWNFIFLAANQDAFKSADDIGISNFSNIAFTPQGVDNMYSTLSRGISNYRSTGVVCQMPEDIE
jgi:uncharacterized protein YegL